MEKKRCVVGIVSDEVYAGISGGAVRAADELKLSGRCDMILAAT